MSSLYPIIFNQNRPLVIRTQFGDDSIALVQWLHEQQYHLSYPHQPLQVVYLDTGFAAASWEDRVNKGVEHIKTCGFAPVLIPATIPFKDAIQNRGEFPSPKFQWCSALLKGLPFLDWLDTWDIQCKTIIMMAKRHAAVSRAIATPELIERCEFHHDRSVFHPILNLGDKERDELLKRAGFEPLYHRSLECEPCVNSTIEDIARLNPIDIEKVTALEKDLNIKMFDGLEDEINLNMSIGELVQWAQDYTMSLPSKNDPSQNRKQGRTQIQKRKYQDLFYRGCGNHWGCGL